MIGQAIKAARKAAQMTQEDLANAIGVKRAVISKYENGQIEPRYQTVEKIASALHCSISDLVTPNYGLQEQMDSADTTLQQSYLDRFHSYEIDQKVEIAKLRFITQYPTLSDKTIDNMLLGYRFGLLSAYGIASPDVQTLVSLGFPSDVAEILMQLQELPLDAQREALKQFKEAIEKQG